MTHRTITESKSKEPTCRLGRDRTLRPEPGLHRHGATILRTNGVFDNLTEAEITFDRFHNMKVLGETVDEIRRAEVKRRPDLNGVR